MAVESRFVVIRHGVEAKTFMDKKSADEYDKMLDMADNLADIFAHSPIELTDTVTEELSIYLAQNRDDVLVALLAKKAAKKAEKTATPVAESDATPSVAEESTTDDVDVVKPAKAKDAKKATQARKTKSKVANNDDELNAAS